MGFFHQPDDACRFPQKGELSAAESRELVDKMIRGGESTACTAARILVTYHCVDGLLEVLCSQNKGAAQLAENALWDVWHSEQGESASNRMENGMRHLSAHRHCEAIQIFQELMHAYPKWIEPRFKAATVLFFRERLQDCVDLCKQIVERSPCHFGAWHTMAMCALQLGDCKLARSSIEHSLRLNPHSESNKELLEYFSMIEG